MKIIKAGDLGRLEKSRRFICGMCGCVFEAGPGEYLVEGDYRNGEYCVHKCPTCGQHVTTANERIQR